MGGCFPCSASRGFRLLDHRATFASSGGCRYTHSVGENIRSHVGVPRNGVVDLAHPTQSDPQPPLLPAALRLGSALGATPPRRPLGCARLALCLGAGAPGAMRIGRPASSGRPRLPTARRPCRPCRRRRVARPHPAKGDAGRAPGCQGVLFASARAPGACVLAAPPAVAGVAATAASPAPQGALFVGCPLRLSRAWLAIGNPACLLRALRRAARPRKPAADQGRRRQNSDPSPVALVENVGLLGQIFGRLVTEVAWHMMQWEALVCMLPDAAWSWVRLRGQPG